MLGDFLGCSEGCVGGVLFGWFRWGGCIAWGDSVFVRGLCGVCLQFVVFWGFVLRFVVGFTGWMALFLCLVFVWGVGVVCVDFYFVLWGCIVGRVWGVVSWCSFFSVVCVPVGVAYV